MSQRRIGCWNWSDAWNDRKASPRSSRACGGATRRLWTESGGRLALAAAALAGRAPATLAVVCPTVDQVDELIDDLAIFTRIQPERFPAWESPERAIHDEVFGQRVRLLKRLESADPPKLVVAGIQSLLQSVPSRETLDRQTRSLRVGEALSLDALCRWLAENGLANTPAVELPGEFSIRGGIVDVFAPDWNQPVRIEFFGDEIESIRRFEISNQRSLESQESIDVTIVGAGSADHAHLADYLPPQSWLLLVEPMELEHQGRQYVERMDSEGEGPGVRGQGSGERRAGDGSQGPGIVASGQWPVAGKRLQQIPKSPNPQIPKSSNPPIPNPQSPIPLCFIPLQTFSSGCSNSRRSRPRPSPRLRWKPPAG